jgi:5'-methylthioadenosine phosphorylase
MSQYPEVHLVRELDMCPITIALITDYDAGLVGDVPPVTHQEVIQVFKSNISRLKGLLLNIIENIPEDRANCECYNTSHTS